jgi:hypothetical protein
MNYDWNDGVLSCKTDEDCPAGMLCADAGGAIGEVCVYSWDRAASDDLATGSETASPEDTVWETLDATDSATYTPVETGSQDGDSDMPDDTASHECGADSDCFGETAGVCGVGRCEIESGSFVCNYSPDDALCETNSDCALGVCLSESEGFECSFTIDPEFCQPGDVCDEKAKYSCQAGVCVQAGEADSKRLTFDNKEPFLVDMAPISMSVTATTEGFAAVYAPAEVIWSGTGFVYSNKRLRFGRFDPSGGLLDSGWVEIANTAGFNHPVLLDLKDAGRFALVYQHWTADAHEIGIVELDCQGAIVAGPVLLSPMDNRYSFWPAAAYNSDSGAQGRVGIAFLDTRNDAAKSNSTASTDVYSVVYDVATKAVFGGEARLSSTVLSEREVAITRVPGGFLVASPTSGANAIWTRLVADSGEPETLDSPRYVTRGVTATRPLSLAYDGQRVALAWRAGDSPQGLGVYRVGLLDVDGTPALGGDFVEGAPLGPALTASSNPLSYYGTIEVFWNAERAAFGVCYDSQPGVYSGQAALTTPMLAYAVATEDKTMKAQASFPLSPVDGAHSLAPTCAARGAKTLVLWNDNRDQGEVGSWQGELYGATITCE